MQSDVACVQRNSHKTTLSRRFFNTFRFYCHSLNERRGMLNYFRIGLPDRKLNKRKQGRLFIACIVTVCCTCIATVFYFYFCIIPVVLDKIHPVY